MAHSNKPKIPPFDPELFKILLRYEDGRLFYLPRTAEFCNGDSYAKHWNRQFAGKEAFVGCNRGYKIGSVLGKHFKAHHVVWSMFHGWPESEIDHKDRDRSNNKISNLRLSNGTLNALNRSLRSDNTTGYTGIQKKPNGLYEIRAFGKYAGKAATLEEAVALRSKLTGE